MEGPDPRIPAGGGEKAGTKAHVPTDVNGPMECLDLMALDFKTHIYQAFAQIPSYSAWLLDADLTSTYLYERRVLKLLQWGEPAQPVAAQDARRTCSSSTTSTARSPTRGS